ncbi:MAG: hypothetical protein U0234_09260 [Sandaracinus sp.]
MPPITVPSHAAISLLSSRLAGLLTNSIINECAATHSITPEGSNKIHRLRSIFVLLETDDRRAGTRGVVLATLVMEAHARALGGHCRFTEDVLDELLNAARTLRWDVSALHSKKWRIGITPSEREEPAAPAPSATRSPTRARPRRWEEGLAEMGKLATDGTISPQQRGIQFELILFEVLLGEGLKPTRNVVVPGEQTELTFEIDNGHYLVECKWERRPAGDPEVSRLAHKVRTRPVGVRGIFVSMSGYAGDMDALVQRGGQQQCIGLDQQHVMNVLEGRATWTDVVLRGWRDASIYRRFLAPR